MKLSELLPPERVREIAEDKCNNCSFGPYETLLRTNAINAAAPEIARAALLLAAKCLDDRSDEHWKQVKDAAASLEAKKCAAALRKMAKEIET